MCSQTTTIQYTMVTQLPIKRLYDPKTKKLRKSIVFPRVREVTKTHASSYQEKITVKIKMTGINYELDFIDDCDVIVPGKGMVVKISSIPPSIESVLAYNPKQKYLVFPYTTCKLENQHLEESCECHLVYGKDLDGGLQEFLDVPHQLLIPIPQNISIHDVCFVTEILLPFYNNLNKVHLNSANSKTLILLNDIRKEINEILIIIKHFSISQSSIVFLDNYTISKLKYPSMYSGRFQTVFCFNKSLQKFAEFSCISTGIELTKAKYNIFANFPIIQQSTDKTYHSMVPTFHNKLACQEVLDILAQLNTEQEGLSNTTLTNVKSSSDTNSSSTSSSSTLTSTSAPHFAWIWHERDYDLINFEDLDVDSDLKHKRTYQTIDDMNRLIRSTDLCRICYISRSYKKKNSTLFLSV